MRYLKNIEQFSPNPDLISEGIIYFSPTFRNIVKKVFDTTVDSQVKAIAKIIYNQNGGRIKDDITFVDISPDKSDYITHLKNNNLKKIPNLVKLNPYFSTETDIGTDAVDHMYYNMWRQEQSSDSSGTDGTSGVSGTDGTSGSSGTSSGQGPWDSESRLYLRLSRLVNKIIEDDRFSIRDKENFVNEMRAAIESSKTEFRIVEGEEIRKFYREEVHSAQTGSLKTSCMRHDQCSEYLDIYVNNPQVCKMVILVNKGGKIDGRALLWKLHSSHPEIDMFMDRIYSIDPPMIEPLFNTWARQNGYSHKQENNFRNLSGVVLPDGSVVRANMSVKCEGIYKKFPYIDTFRIYDPKKGILVNSDDEKDPGNAGKYLLASTDGTKKIIVKGIYSDWEDRTIPESEAVWSEVVQSWIHLRNVAEVNIGENQGIYPRGHQEVRWDDYYDRWLHEDDAICSHNDNRCYYRPEAIVLIRAFAGRERDTDTLENVFTNDRANWDVTYWENDSMFYDWSHLEKYTWFNIFYRRYGKFLKKGSSNFVGVLQGRSIEGFHVRAMKTVYLSLDNEEGVTIDRLLTLDTYKVSGKDRWLSYSHADALGISVDKSKRLECYLDYMITRGPEILDKLRRIENPSGDVLEEIHVLEQFFSEWGPYICLVKENPEVSRFCDEFNF